MTVSLSLTPPPFRRTTSEVAARLKIGRRGVLGLRLRGKLKARRVGRRYLYHVEDVDALPEPAPPGVRLRPRAAASAEEEWAAAWLKREGLG
jgi:excisionase family DNA binding protein